ncbi:hypothetical protein [Parachryseolinea silvisoli]|uniref:hypothetical protein n=1 Tax=Parachryseolinea silvisoli TaxID=2873601 RepID=UPI002265C748|nr:hypothetical protein [Parachryseolinea silvisoli]MCD9019043.1 hypothetical protein [Parachryseolinea silvisoli]
MRMKTIGLAACILLFFQLAVQAQDTNITVRAGFIEDSLRVGDPVRFYLTARYAQGQQVLFPDSTFAYAPFELDHRSYTPTDTRDGMSYDSVVYHVTTFELDERPSLSLPVYLLTPQDCTAFESPRDTIRLALSPMPGLDSITIDKLPLRENVAYHDVPQAFNYIIALIVGGAFLLIAILVWVFFGRRIRRYFRIRRMLKMHEQFMIAYGGSLAGIHSNFSAANAEHVLAQWKRYMEQLEIRPYTKMTTREIQAALKDDAVTRTLKAIDGAIYGHSTQAATESLANLRDLANQRFAVKLQEVKNG